jgi:hypothetical protein
MDVKEHLHRYHGREGITWYITTDDACDNKHKVDVSNSHH